MRADAVVVAATPGTDAPLLQYSVGGVAISDANIRIKDIESDPGYGHAVAGLLAKTICQSAQVQRFLGKLSAGPGAK